MKTHKLLTICLLFFPLIFCQFWPHLSIQNARAETDGQQLPWDKLYEKEPPRNEDTGGSRGGNAELCTISPESFSGEAIRVWSDRPLFLWQGNISKIEVRKHRSPQVLWSEKIASNNNSVLYNGPRLQPGENYDWVLFEDASNIGTFQVSFQVIPSNERELISAELNKLETQLQQEGSTPEKIAYARANYFAERKMWPDVLRSAYEVKNPSEALTNFIQNIPKQFCKS